MTLIVETGAGILGANSYISLEDATSYHSAGMTAEEWELVEPEEQERLLVTATRLLDATIDWIGYRATAEQSLDWPRMNVRIARRFIAPLGSVPMQVRHATAEMALHLKRRPTPSAAAETAAASAVEEVKLGPISVKMSQTSQTAATATATSPTTTLPAEVLALIRDFGSYSGGSVRMARMVR